MPILSDRALILRRFAWAETSLVLQVLTREHGRVHLVAKGAYRPKSRLFGVLDLFDTLSIEWSATRGRDLHPLREASLLERRHRIADEIPRFRAALTVLELANLAAREDQRARELFDLIERALDRLRDGRVPSQSALVEFELGFLQNLGLAPALIRCAACGGPAEPVQGRAGSRVARAAFSTGAGGRLCRRCAEEARSAGRRVGTLPDRVLRLGQQVLESSVRGDDPPAAEPVELERLRDVVARFLEYHLETRPRSYESFLAAPSRNHPRASGTRGRRTAPPAKGTIRR